MMVRVAAVGLVLAVALMACGGRPPVPTATTIPLAAESTKEAKLSPTPAKQVVGQETPTSVTLAQETRSTTGAHTLTPSPSPVASRTTAATAEPTDTPTSTPSVKAASTPVSPAEQPAPTVPAIDLPAVTVTGLIATVPGYAKLDVSQVTVMVEQVYPGRVPTSVQALVLLTEDDEVYLILALDTHIDRFITAGTVIGHNATLLPGIPTELDFAQRLIVSDNVKLMEPVRATPDQVNQTPKRYASKRVIADTTYVFSSVRVKDAPPSLKHIGFGLATDKFGSQSRNDYLTVIDPYNTDSQIRVAELTGTVLFPTKAARSLLGQLYKFAPEDVEKALSKPSLFYEKLIDDDPELHNIRDLASTIQDPSLKLHSFHGETVSVQGLALGEMVKTEELPVPYIERIPVHVTAKLIGVADFTGAMPVIGISSEDVAGEVFGFFRFELSVFNFGGQAAYAFLIGKESVPLDPVAEVSRAEFGDRVKATLENYLVTETERIRVTEDLTLEQVDLLLPSNEGDPMIMTRHGDLRTGDFLSSVSFDGYLVDGQILGVPQTVPYERTGTIVVNAAGLSFQRGVPPTPIPPGLPTPAPVGPTPMATPVATPTPAPTIAPVATATPVPAPTPTPVPTYSLGVSVDPSNGGMVTLSPPGGSYAAGPEVAVTAVAAPGFTFDRWEDDASGSRTTVTVKMDGDKAVTAHFKRSIP